MAGLSWFRLDMEFFDDPKISALRSRLREPLADAYVARIYAYCYRHAKDRFDPAVASDTIEDAARWKGRRGTLFHALMAVEVLEREAGKVVVHGVKARLVDVVTQRGMDNERKRRWRAKLGKSLEGGNKVTRDETRDETRTSPVASASSPPSPYHSPSQYIDRSPSRDVERLGNLPAAGSNGSSAPAAPFSGSPALLSLPGGDAEAEAIVSLLPAKAADVAASLDVPRQAIEFALNELATKGVVQLRPGLVPIWERVAL